MSSATAQHAPTTGPAASSRRAARVRTDELHHRPGQLTGQRVEIASDQAGSAHRVSTRPFWSSASIGSNATLTLPSRQYARYSDSYK